MEHVTVQEGLLQQAVFFSNRLLKRWKHLKKWAKRTGVTCFRLYDRDIPEIPLSVDVYEDCLYASLYERPYEKSDDDESAWLESMLLAASNVLQIPRDHIYTRTRKRQKGNDQYEKNTADYVPEPWKHGNGCILAKEGGLSFYVNLTDYLDTGLFLDHRPLRQTVRQQSAGKRVLNLFCYTGSFSVYAASGGATRVDSVDLSKTYLAWARANCLLNNFPAYQDSFIHDDVFNFLHNALAQKRTWDIIILDPPTFSNSKRMEDTLDINNDWPDLVVSCIRLLTSNGILYFSTNSRRLKFDPAVLTAAVPFALIIDDISTTTIPEDFRNQNIHRCYRISRV